MLSQKFILSELVDIKNVQLRLIEAFTYDSCHLNLEEAGINAWLARKSELRRDSGAACPYSLIHITYGTHPKRARKKRAEAAIFCHTSNRKCFRANRSISISGSCSYNLSPVALRPILDADLCPPRAISATKMARRTRTAASPFRDDVLYKHNVNVWQRWVETSSFGT